MPQTQKQRDAKKLSFRQPRMLQTLKQRDAKQVIWIGESDDEDIDDEREDGILEPDTAMQQQSHDTPLSTPPTWCQPLHVPCQSSLRRGRSRSVQQKSSSLQSRPRGSIARELLPRRRTREELADEVVQSAEPFRRLQGTMALEIWERVVRQRASASTTECTGAVIGKNAGGKQTFHIPTFYVDARGTAKDWNDGPRLWHWGGKAKKRFPFVPNVVVDPTRVMKFFNSRLCPHGRPVSKRLGQVKVCTDGWFCYPWLDFCEGELPIESGRKLHWEKAWHGCKFEALYSILYHGRLFDSKDVAQGHRYFPDDPGVYMHKEGTAHNAESYMRFTPL